VPSSLNLPPVKETSGSVNETSQIDSGGDDNSSWQCSEICELATTLRSENATTCYSIRPLPTGGLWRFLGSPLGAGI
jgi:hypothetical protein